MFPFPTSFWRRPVLVTKNKSFSSYNTNIQKNRGWHPTSVFFWLPYISLRMGYFRVWELSVKNNKIAHAKKLHDNLVGFYKVHWPTFTFQLVHGNIDINTYSHIYIVQMYDQPMKLEPMSYLWYNIVRKIIHGCWTGEK